MRIGLIDCDGTKFPNLALMKLSAFHKMIEDYRILLKEVIYGNNE